VSTPDLDTLTPEQIANMPSDRLLRLAAVAAREDLDALGEHADDEDRALGAIFEAAAHAASTDQPDDHRAVTAAFVDLGRLMLLEMTNEEFQPAGGIA
jgi:hypothetical protein